MGTVRDGKNIPGLVKVASDGFLLQKKEDRGAIDLGIKEI